MLYELLFKKKIKKQELKKQELYAEIRKIKSEKIILKENLNFEKKRFERIKFLLNNRVHKNAKCLIEKTKKDFNVLTAINDKDYEIELFDLDNIEYNLNRTMVLWANNREKEFFIKDIQGGNGNGHGEVAMKHLIDFAKEQSKERIIGEISSVDFDHKDRLTAFYEKMGFKVNYKSDGNGNVEKKL
jgi:hypothetical protein